MDKTIYDFTFCAIDLGIQLSTIQQMLDEVRNVNSDHWYDDTFRGCKILPLFNGGGTTGSPPEGVLRSKGEMIITPAGEQCPVIMNVAENYIFNFMSPVGRMSVLKTEKNQGLNIHIDSNQKSIGTTQHKFRIVLNGHIDKLFFLDQNNQKVYVPKHYNTYVLDGTHPHSIDGGEEKITICIGAPWSGFYTEKYKKLIESSPFKMKVSRPEFKQEWECK